MKKMFLKVAALCAALMPFAAGASQAWKEIDAAQAPKEARVIKPSTFKAYSLDVLALRSQFQNLPTNPDFAETISLPMPDGSMRDFRIWATPMMPQSLAAQYPDITTYTATAVDNQSITAKLDFTIYGFHAMIFDGGQVSFIDPISDYNNSYYQVYYKTDLSRTPDQRSKCLLTDGDEHGPAGEPTLLTDSGLPQLAAKTLNGYQLRTYRLALSCSNQYAIAVAGASPTKAAVLAKMTTTMNRVNGVFEREMSLTMTFVANENSLIFTTAATDPFNAINNDGGECLSENKDQCNTLIGSANYDIGHVFTTASGGLATLGCVCTNNKAQGTTGSLSPTGDFFDIDFVAHEMGHQFGATHTFNNSSNGSCAGSNRQASTAYEPGSGSTIMAYAGICNPDNVQAHSDPYYHRASLDQMVNFVNGTGNCATKTSTGNKFVKYEPMTTTTWSIPYLTPFELIAPAAIDSMDDSAVLYCWEEDDKSSSGSTWAAASATGPLFRSMPPTTSVVRIFPKYANVLINNLNKDYEKAPTVARTLTFKLTYRNIRNNKGCITIPDETVTLNAVTTGTGEGFKVTSQSSPTTLAGASTTTVTWNVLNTASAPINAANVDIYMVTNSGALQYFIGTFPNTGSASITVPNPATSTGTARFKVKGSGNVFFNVNSINFTVTNTPTAPVSPTTGTQSVALPSHDIKVYPVPADDVLHLSGNGALHAGIYNLMGQQVWAGPVNGTVDVQVAGWAKGTYLVRFISQAGMPVATKQVLIK